MLSFPPFRLEPSKSRLWKGDAEIPLRRKPFAILRYLAEHAQRLVTHEEIVDAIWGNVTVSESLLRTHVRELRMALGENVIETIVGHGYRFVPAVAATDHGAGDWPGSDRSGSDSARPMVGRDRELTFLREAHERSLRPKREIVFVTGEAGIGKTTLVDAALAGAASRGPVWIATGRCVEQYGRGEPYLPVLAALGRLCRGSDGGRVVDILLRRAPSWLVQMPGLVPDETLDTLQHRVLGTAQARMLRELAEALEVLSAEKPVILALDDLHWSDDATLDLIATLAAWNESARLFVVGTCRREALAKTHPLNKVMAELCAHGRASIVSLEGLPRPAFEQYFSARFPGHTFPEELGQAIQRTTGGNPLYMIALLDDLETRGMIERARGPWQLATSIEEVAALRPETVTQLIDAGIDRLDAFERRVLEAASVAGAVFVAGVVARVLDAPVDLVDSSCETLAKDRRFLRDAGTERWPDGTVQSRYAFAHALYEHAALSRVPSATRRNWHRLVAEHLEAAYGDGSTTLAAELAAHFEKAQELAKAAHYYVLAGERDGERFAGTSALERFEHARSLLSGLPETRARDALELRLLLDAARMLVVVQDAGRTDLRASFERGAELARRLGDDDSLAAILTGLQALRLGRGAFAEVMDNAPTVHEVADRAQDPFVQTQSKIAPSLAAMFRGDLVEAQRALTVVHANAHLQDERRRRAPTLGAPAQPAVVSGAYLAMLLWHLGRPDAAIALANETILKAQSFGDPYSLSMAWCSAGMVRRWCRNVTATIEAASRAAHVASEYGLPRWQNRATILLAWARCHSGEPAPDETARELFAAHEGVIASAPVMRTWVTGPFVETCERLGRIDLALRELADGLAHAERTGERAWEPEIHRLQGELARSTDPSEAKRSFETAIELAERQSSKSFLLRATMSLHRLSTATGERTTARQMLERVYGSFAEGFGTGDLREARALLG